MHSIVLKTKLPTRTANRLRRALESSDLSWEELSSKAEQVILFGSCAAGCERRGSDVDLLCVGEGDRLDTGRLHLLWVEPSSLSDPAWLRSEIGGHIARYGIWLKGESSLGPPQPASKATLDKKRTRIADRARVLIEKWQMLSSAFRDEQLRQLRLDIQRLVLLRNGKAVDPNPLLDRLWGQEHNRHQWIENTLVNEGELLKLVTSVIDLALSGHNREFEQVKSPA